MSKRKNSKYVRKQSLYQKVIREIAKREAGLVEVGVGNIREVVRIVSQMAVADPKIFLLLLRLGLRKKGSSTGRRRTNKRRTRKTKGK